MGLPPPLPLKLNNRTTFMPKLAIGNLGLSTLAKNEGGKTAEEMADAEILDQNKKQKKDQIVEEHENDEEDSQTSDFDQDFSQSQQM